MSIALRLVVPKESTVPVRADLEYSPCDPYAVHMIFRAGQLDDESTSRKTSGTNDVSWSFSRELLTEGLYRQTGLGDVKAWPWAGCSRQSLGLALSSPDGYALFELPRAPIEDFLTRTYALVAAGAESDLLEIDHALAHLLSTPDADAH